MEQTKPTRLIVGITGATGTIFGVRLLQMLHGSGVETHLVVSKWAARTLTHETPHSLKYVQSLATRSYGIGAQGAAISSGSFVTLGMVIAPCSICSNRTPKIVPVAPVMPTMRRVGLVLSMVHSYCRRMNRWRQGHIREHA